MTCHDPESLDVTRPDDKPGWNYYSPTSTIGNVKDAFLSENWNFWCLVNLWWVVTKELVRLPFDCWLLERKKIK